MEISTKFKRGDIVTDRRGHTFRIGEIMVKVWEYREREVTNITYREIKPGNDPRFPNWIIKGRWIQEDELRG